MAAEAIAKPAPIRLDLGCGINKKATDDKGAWTGVDSISFDGVDVVMDLMGTWPWEDGTVDEAHCSHVIEHFDPRGRCHFMNELFRVLKPGAQVTVIVPHWAHARAYGDPTHQWPPISEWFFLYLNREWRSTQAPHTDAQNIDWGYSCDFVWSYGYNLDNELVTGQYGARNDEFKQFLVQFGKNSVADFIGTLTKPLPPRTDEE